MTNEGKVLTAGKTRNIEVYNKENKKIIEEWTDIKRIHAVGSIYGIDSHAVLHYVDERGSHTIENVVSVVGGIWGAVVLLLDGTVKDYRKREKQDSSISNWRNIVYLTRNSSKIIGICSDGTVVYSGEEEYGLEKVRNWKLFSDVNTAEQRRLARIQRARVEKVQKLKTEVTQLSNELANLKGLFVGKKRKELQEQIELLNVEITSLQKSQP